MYGNEYGPINGTCINPYNASLPEQWQWTTSKVLDSSNGSNFTVFLRPGVILPVNLTILIPKFPSIDFFFLCDASYSMGKYIATVQLNMNAIALNLTKIVTDSNPEATIMFGLASFLEKPISPYANFPEAYVYKLRQNLTNDLTLVQNALGNLTFNLLRNYEHPEDSLEAIMHASFDNSIGFRDGSFHIIMLITDASGHVAGQELNLGINTPNNYDGILDGWPPGTGEGYPNSSDVRNLLISNNVNPIFGIASPNVTSFWNLTQKEWGIGALVQITSDSNTVVNSIVEGTLQVLSTTILGVLSDPLNRIDMIYPYSGNSTKTGVIYNVSSNTNVNFTVYLLADINNKSTYGLPSTILLRYVGLSTIVQFNVNTAVTCLGCDPTHPNLTVDICGKCGGNNSECIGCDGQLFSNARYDICGVCGGRNDSCLGCDGVLFGKQYDACGVCGGNNSTCLGCDGVINSGLRLNSCKQCGGAVNCNPALGTVITALGVLAGIAIAFVIVAVIFAASATVTLAKVDETMLAKETSLQENPLYEEAKRKFDNPLFGKEDQPE